jgi:uncharacterized protein
MEQRISVITVAVADLERSRRFYEDGLGWSPRSVHEDIAFYQLNGIVLGLFARASFNADAHLPSGTESVGGIALAYNVRSREEVDRVMAAAEAAGAKITKPAEEVFWGGYSGYFTDPDGHLWELAWNPGWPIDEQGNVTMPA